MENGPFRGAIFFFAFLGAPSANPAIAARDITIELIERSEKSFKPKAE